MTPSKFSIRPAVVDDVPLILQFIQKKAVFDRDIGAFSGALAVTEDRLHQTLFSSHPFAYVLFADAMDFSVGFALYAFRYSSFSGQPSLWLDDLFVDADYRSQGVGALLMSELAEISVQRGCSHLGWTADDRNIGGLRFYQRLGAEVIGRQDHRCFLKWIPADLAISLQRGSSSS